MVGLIAQASSRGFILRTLGDTSNRKPQELSRWRRSEPRANEQASMLLPFPQAGSAGRRDAGDGDVEDCCGAGVTPVRFRALGCLDPQAQIRLGSYPRPGERVVVT